MSALLTRLCDPGSIYHAAREPFYVRLDGEQYLVATNGAAIAAVIDAGEDKSETQLTVRDTAAAHLRRPAETPVDIQRLIEFCGSPGWTADCTKCNGTGTTTCDTCHGTQRTTHYCDVCDHTHMCGCPDCDDGTMHCACMRRSTREVLIHGTPFDGRLVARALAAAGATGPAMMGIDDKTLVVRGDGWRIVVRRLTHANGGAPEFR